MENLGSVLEFEGYRLDASERRLSKEGAVVPLAPKAFELLIYLVRNSGHLLTKEQLLDAVWPGTFVEEANLANNISLVRRVLGRRRNGSEFVETVPRHGYRFTAPVEKASEPAAPRIDSVAVLPFLNLSAEPALDLWCEGLTEEVIAALARIPRLRVPARTSVWRFRGESRDVREIAGALAVDAVVEGSVRRGDSGLRIAAQFIRAADDCHLWSDAFDVEERHPIEVQCEAGEAIAASFREHCLAPPVWRPSAQSENRPGPTRFIALPFRMLRPDPDAEFLAYSLPDAITSALSGVDSLVVRSSLAAARFTSAEPALRRVAAEAHVDVVLTGTVLRCGGEVRISAQLMDAAEGAVTWSIVRQLALDDLFHVHEEIVTGILQSLTVALSGRERRLLAHSVPATARAYEFYLRANELFRHRSVDNGRVARDLYLACLDEDPTFAPAWASLGRCYRFLEKFGEEDPGAAGRAQHAFDQAFAHSPDLPLAHSFYTITQADLGRAPEAMVRLLERARYRRCDSELFAGLVLACRFCGELEASVAADARARALDPNAITSAAHTFFLLGTYEKALERYEKGRGYYMDAAALCCLGRPAEALERLRQRKATNVSYGAVQALMDSLQAILEGDRHGATCAAERALANSTRVGDPEAHFYAARHLSRLCEKVPALNALREAVESGFLCSFALMNDPWLEPLRDDGRFRDLLACSLERERECHSTFLEAGGPEMLSAY